jgi:aryl-alcohol dehydrogenase-like predicted oxidoreductase
MRYRKLGSTELEVSVVGLGTWQFGGEWGRDYAQAEVDAILDAAAELGVNLIDTAECYGDHRAESLIGDYLSRRDRDRWILATKFGHRFHGFMDRTWHLSPQEVRDQLEESLRALRTDRIDVYQFHSGSDEAFRQPELWAMLEEQKRADKIRHFGAAIASKGSLPQAQEARSYGLEVLQVVYSRLERRAESDYFPIARRDDLGILARVPLASGFLSGKYTSADSFSANDMRSTIDAEKVARWLREIPAIREQEVPAGVPMAQWALAWCLKNPLVSSVIPGARDAEQMRLNAFAADLDLPLDAEVATNTARGAK